MVSTTMPGVDKHVILLGGLLGKKKLAQADKKKEENRIRACHVYLPWDEWHHASLGTADENVYGE